MSQPRPNQIELQIQDYPFVRWDFGHYLATVFKDRGVKAIYQFLNRPIRRAYSRSLLKKFAPQGIGLEIGVGARTIAPVERTILSDAFSEHGVHASIAKVFFQGESIPYPSETFDFVLSEHVLEHITNPIKILKEWLRVLKDGGVIFCFLPHKERTNDCHREVTSLQHLLEDFKRDVPANDDFHLSEWRRNVVERGLMPAHYQHMNNQELLDSHSIHHHAWTEKEIVELFNHLGLKILFVDSRVHDRRDSFVVIAQK
jgi:SAM-dependent methyltransferase